MAEVKITYYQCDCCKNKFASQNKIFEVSVPAKEYDCQGFLIKNPTRTAKKLDLCDKCYDKLRNVVFEHFAQIEDGISLNVIPKFNCSSWQTEEINNT